MSTHPQSDPLIELKRRIASKRALVVCGTGVTIQATDDASLLWDAVILHGRDYAVSHGLAPHDSWPGLVEQNLKVGMESGDMTSLLNAAALVGGTLRKGGAWGQWMKERFGALTATSDHLHHAIAGLRLPIVTTNYDTLIERSLGRQVVNRTDVAIFQSLLSGATDEFVGHLHGAWLYPDSIVFTHEDYAKVATDEGSGTLHRAALAIGSAIYIGFGAGLQDPNFDAVSRHLTDRLGMTHHTHYRLCLQSEFTELMQVHSDGTIVPVVYGNEYADLVSFLESLSFEAIDRRTLGNTVTVSREIALTQLVQQSHEDSLLETISEGGADEPFINPVLLPVPQEVFDRTDTHQLRRVDADQVLAAGGNVLLVGAERSGLTSALKWMLMHRAKHDGSAVPLYLNFGSVKLTKKAPISEALVREASSVGAIPSPAHPLPTLSIGLDDFFVSDRDRSRLASDLASLAGNWLVIGCRPVDEPEVTSLLQEAGLSFDTLYAGRLSSADVGLYAKRADPMQAKRLAKQVITTMREERLPATPQTVLMLLGILIKDQNAHHEPTPSLVDRFVARLMADFGSTGTRVTLEPQDLLDILEYFARDLALSRVSEMRLSEFLDMLERYQREVGWTFQSHEVFDRLVGYRLLVVRDDRVRFTLTSYLYLFAARHARNDPSFRETLLSEPFFFADVLVHYSALARNDEQVLEVATGLMDLLSADTPLGPVFSPDDSIEEIEIPDGASFEVAKEVEPRSRKETDGDRDAVPDTLGMSDRQPEPFALSRDFRPQSFFIGIIGCEFGAAVLRNSDQVKNPGAKRAATFSLLGALGRVVDRAQVDPEYLKFCHEVASSFDESFAETAEESEEFQTFMAEHFPGLVAASVLGSRLNGSKIGQALDRIVLDAVSQGDVRVASLGLVLSIFLNTPGLRESLRAVSGRYARVRHVRQVVMSFAFYRHGYTTDPALKSALEEFIVDVNMGFLKFKGGPQARQRAKNDILRQVRDRDRKSLKEDEAIAAEISLAEGAIDGLVIPGEVHDPNPLNSSAPELDLDI